jgi:membrane-associated phospholipid phosphatase
MSTPGSENLNTAAENETQQTPALSRRKFLGGVGGLAAAMTVGAAGLEPLVNAGSQAAAAEVGPLIGDPRLKAAYELRIDAANALLQAGIPARHPCNGDEDLYPSRIGNYSKGLPHNDFGEVDPDAYKSLLVALSSGHPDDFENIHLGGVRKLTNPQAGLAYDTEGLDPHQFKFPVAPAFASAEAAGEAVELYWMALLRDVNFTNYASNATAQAAAAELSQLSDFRGPKINGQVTTQTLFRDNLPGTLVGPYISQFMLKPTPFGAERVVRRMRTLVANSDKMTQYKEWLDVQNGNVPGTQQFDSTERYIRNGRDLGQWVHVDVLFQAYFNACLILGTPPDASDPFTGGGIGCPANPGNPYLSSRTQDGFGTWGGPFFKTLLCEVSTRALKTVWFQKWFVHRRLRPEAYGGRIHVHRNGWRQYPLHSDVLNSQALAKTKAKTGTFLLPQVFPEGSPTHPAYGAGHATVAGACVTILKALFDENFTVPKPVVPNLEGTELVPLLTTSRLTVGGELNKLASNVATGRNIAGVHWRSDGLNSLMLGEAIAIALLREHKATFNEGGSFRFTSFSGQLIEI